MSYYFTLLSPTDKPLFSHTFGTSKGGGDGQPHFNFRTFSSAAIANLAASTGGNPSAASATTQYMNQFLVHASLDIVEEVQWLNNNMYLKTVDTYPPTNAHISCWITGTNVRFLILYQPNAPTSTGSSTTSGGSVIGGSGRGGMNPGSQQMEEAIRGFMTEVFESWVKCLMNPFYKINMEVKSPVFRQRVVNAARKWL